MSKINLLPSQQAGVVGFIRPDATPAGTVTSGWVSLAEFDSVQAIVQTGVLGANATVDAKIEQATSAAGAGAKDIVDKSITQLTKAANDNNQAIINVRTDDLDVANKFTHVRLNLTVATATSDVGAVLMGHHPRYGWASDNDAASVVEIIE